MDSEKEWQHQTAEKYLRDAVLKAEQDLLTERYPDSYIKRTKVKIRD